MEMLMFLLSMTLGCIAMITAMIMLAMRKAPWKLIAAYWLLVTAYWIMKAMG